MDLNYVNVFVRVMEAGSFTVAAQQLGLPKSSVSRRVSALEKSLRVRLLQRSTRKLVLTEAGRLYFDRAKLALGGLADASAAVTDMSQEIAGVIRFTAGPDNTGMIASLVAGFLAQYPKVQLDVVLTARRVDLMAEGFDLAMRAGPLIDSSLVLRRLGRSDLGLFASRSYLRKEGTPGSVAELERHRFVLFGSPHDGEQLRLTGPRGEERVKVKGPLVVHDMTFATDAISAGIGIGLVPEAYLGWVFNGGSRATHPDLVRVLPDHAATGAELTLVSPPSAYEPTRVALFRDFLTERLRPLMQACTLAISRERESRQAAAKKPAVAVTAVTKRGKRSPHRRRSR